MCGKILLLTFLLLPFALQAQEIPKKANTIIIREASINEVANILLDKGFIIDAMDTVLKTVDTKPKHIKSCTVTVNARLKDSSIYVHGSMDMNLTMHLGSFESPLGSIEISNKGMKGSAMRDAWNELNAFALSFGKPVEYSIQ